MDDVEDQVSSWESERERVKAEELAIWETPDDEREWCWPRRNRITRWRRRMGPRPAVHQLAEDDEDEQASGGLNHLVHETLEEFRVRGRKSPLQSTGEGQRRT